MLAGGFRLLVGHDLEERERLYNVVLDAGRWSRLLAARWQGKYLAAHDALLNGSRLTQNNQVDLALNRAGIDLGALKMAQTSHAKDIDALLARNDAEAHALHLRGTPGIVIGRELLPGIVDLNGLKQLVADSRHDLQSN